MSKRFHFTVLSIAALAALSATAIYRQTQASPQSHACFAVSQGVCFSGTTEWVAKAAEATPARNTITLAMAGDAF